MVKLLRKKNVGVDRVAREWRSALIWVAGVWFVFGAGLSYFFSDRGLYSVWCFLALFLGCFLDIWSLGLLIGSLIRLMTEAEEASEKRTALAVQAFFWGTVKLACLGILGIILYFLPDPPKVSLLLGLATLVIISLAGGWIWSQRVVRHA